MKRLPRLPSVLIFGVALLGCAERTDSGAAHAWWLAHAPAAPLPEPVATPTDETSSADDAELEAFEEQLRKRCHVAPEPMSTVEMVGYFGALQDCAEKRIRGLLAQLPAAPRALLRGAPLAAFHEAACWLDDAQQFSGRARTAGTMRSVTWASCRSFTTERTLYWLEQYSAGDSARFVRHVRLQAEMGRRAERQQAKLADYARALAATAPETAFEDDGCPLCTLGDADFRKLLRVHATVQAAAKDLADMTCSTWPELDAALGGGDACRAELRSYWLVEAGGGYGEPLDDARWSVEEDEDADDQSRTLPPAKDPDYAAVVEPLYVACEADNHDAAPRMACLRKLAREKLAGLSSAQQTNLSRIDAAWQRFAQQLCIVDEAALRLTDAHLAGYGEPTCRLLQAARGAHLMSRWANHEVNELHRHILARRAWAERAGKGLSWLKSQVLAKREQTAVEQLPVARHELAHAVCSAWPGLDDTTETCDELLELHLLSYAQHLGAPAAAPD